MCTLEPKSLPAVDLGKIANFRGTGMELAVYLLETRNPRKKGENRQNTLDTEVRAGYIIPRRTTTH